MSGIERIAAERERQTREEGWTLKNDDLYVDGEIVAAAACYVLSGSGWERKVLTPLTMLWPWSFQWWKPADRIRNLEKAGALIAAEIDRLERLTARDKEPQP